MPETTLIRPEKLGAYAETVYRIDDTQEPISLTIGVYSAALERLFVDSGVECGAFITAHNPRGALQSPKLNEQASTALADLLRDRGYRVLSGTGGAENVDWPVEASWFALGVPLAAARAIGKLFDQDAIVWVDRDAVPQLILLR